MQEDKVQPLLFAPFLNNMRVFTFYGSVNAAGKKQVNLSFMFNTLPVFFLNMKTVESGDGMWHSGRWRFASCDADGKAKKLAV
ncbi:hypothetical protein B0T17DRAFT_530102 [Bombardia bombarda]|uniref:Uncharacterized protein n=1 Tax=Bombardia bombarda TaxID=252184 RepID=A0AA39XCW3_9PEZI|nr:hypothetical protein B0T17DRAFT_530102 [Bombardia bombarda]